MKSRHVLDVVARQAEIQTRIEPLWDFPVLEWTDVDTDGSVKSRRRKRALQDHPDADAPVRVRDGQVFAVLLYTALQSKFRRKEAEVPVHFAREFLLQLLQPKGPRVR